MITNMLEKEPTISEMDWLLAYITENVDWKNPFRNEEFDKLKAFVADATMQPIDCVTVDKDTDGGKLYNKLRIQAKEERLDSITADIHFIRMDSYSHLGKERGMELAALEYVKRVHGSRNHCTKQGYGGAWFTCSSEERADRAIELHKNFRKKVRTSLSKVSYK